MIAIINIGGCSDGVTKYQVQINHDLICTFEHNRTDGLGICLLEASKAVERHRWAHAKELVDEILKQSKKPGEKNGRKNSRRTKKNGR